MTNGLRRDWTRTSSTLPRWSTTRNRHRSLALIPTNTSSRCHLSPERTAPPAQLVGVGMPELGAPPPDRLVTHRDTAYQHQLLDLTEAQREPEVQPPAVVDDLDRLAVTLVRRRCGGHPTTPPSSPTLTNVTVPVHDLGGRCRHHLLLMLAPDGVDHPPDRDRWDSRVRVGGHRAAAAGWRASGGKSPALTVDCSSTYPLRPSAAHSRPMPDCLKPPNGLAMSMSYMLMP